MRRAVLTAIVVAAVVIARRVAGAGRRGASTGEVAQARRSSSTARATTSTRTTSVPPFRKQRVITNARQGPRRSRHQRADLLLPRDDEGGTRWFIAGEDTGQPNPPQGWGIFQLKGNKIGKLQAKQDREAHPDVPGLDSTTRRTTAAGSCPDGRVVTTDIGNQASGDGDGQLIVWFPPFNRTQGAVLQDRHRDRDRGQHPRDATTASTSRRPGRRPPACGATPARSRRRTPRPAGAAAPTRPAHRSPTRCRRRSSSRPAAPIATPNAIARSPRRLLRVERHHRRHRRVRPRRRVPAQRPRARARRRRSASSPYATGTPLGLGVDRRGNLFYADIGIVVSADGVGPG